MKYKGPEHYFLALKHLFNSTYFNQMFGVTTNNGRSILAAPTKLPQEVLHFFWKKLEK